MENFKIYGADGSTAQRYANDNNFEFIEIKSVSSEDGIKIEYTNDTTIGEEDVSISLVTKKLSNSDPEYAKILKEAGLSSVFMQFDGTKDEIYRIHNCKYLTKWTVSMENVFV